MIAEVGCIIAGIPLGYALRNHAPMVRVANAMASAIIYVLLFLLGLSLGSNEQLLARLGELGVQGFAIGFGCALGSIVVTAYIAKIFFQFSTIQGGAGAGNAHNLIASSATPAAPEAQGGHQ